MSNLEEPKINDNNLEKTMNNLEEPKKVSNNKNFGHVKTLEFLISKTVIINPLTTDKKYFLDSVTFSLHHETIGKNNTRPNNIRKYSDTLDWKNINF